VSAVMDGMGRRTATATPHACIVCGKRLHQQATKLIRMQTGGIRFIVITDSDGEPVLQEKSQDGGGIFFGKVEEEVLMGPIYNLHAPINL
jgi:hypothetical protein